MTATTPKIPTSITATEPVMLGAGIITALVYMLQAAGIITVPEAQQLGPQLNAVVVAFWPLVIMVGGYIGRHYASSPATVAQIAAGTSPVTSSTPPVTSAPAIPLPAPVTTSTGSTPVPLTIVSSTDLPPGTEGSIAAGTRRWDLDGGRLSDVGPAIVGLASIVNVTGDINGHFYRTTTNPPYYVTMRSVSLDGETVSAAPPAATFDPNAPYPGSDMTILQAAGLDASGQAQRVAPNGGVISATVAAVDGAAAKYGFNGVEGVSNDGEWFYVVFVKGRIVGMVQGGPTTDTVALAAKYGLGGNDFDTVTP